jgi:prevent-host-death family protein
METTVTTTEAARHLGDILARVKHKGERFLFTKNDQPVARLIPADLSRFPTGEQLMHAVERLPIDPAFADDLERVCRADQVPENPWD